MNSTLLWSLCATPALALALVDFQAADAPQLVWGDFDGDGLADLATLEPNGPVRILKNLGDGSLEDVTEGSGIVAFGARSASWQDVDGDGAQDLFLVQPDGKSTLYRGLGRGQFEDATAACGLAAAPVCTDARWLDYDGDGHADLELHTAMGVTLFHNDGKGSLERTGHAWAAAAGEPGVAVFVPPTTDASGPDAASAGTASSSSGTSGATERGAPVGTGSGRQAIGGGSIGGSSPHGGSILPGTAGSFCADGINDAQLTGICIGASTVPQIDKLYPLTSDFFIDTNADIGMGTINPRSRLHVRSATAEATLRLNTGTANGTSKVLLLENNNGEGALLGGVVAYDGAADQLKLGSLTNGTESTQMVINRTNGRVGLNTTNPVGRLHVVGSNNLGSIFVTPSSTGTGNDSRVVLGEQHDANFGFAMRCDGSANELLFQGVNNGIDTTHMTVGRDNGMVSVGAATGDGRLEVFGNRSGITSAPLRVTNTDTGAGNAAILESNGTATTAIFKNLGTGAILKAETSAGTLFTVSNTGRVITTALQITGGGDLVEGFGSTEELEPGTVVAIDPENPGELVATKRAYDTKVAGVISGANGVNHGIRMGQDDVLDGEHLVAMAGRVYVRCTDENGAIQPGDLLTSASREGCAMRATDSERSFGAVIGKAMTALDEESGLVLVLVSLQ